MAQISAHEQEMLELINRARSDPAGEYALMVADAATVTGTTVDITNAMRFFGVDPLAYRDAMAGFASVAPLAWNSSLNTAAEAHSEAQLAANMQSHQVPGEPPLGTRVENAGYTGFRTIGENVYAYADNVFFGHAGFMIDWGYDAEDFTDANTLHSDWRTRGDGMQDPAGHRLNILSSDFTEIGIGYLSDSDLTNAVGPNIVTQNFGNRFAYSAQLLGVVINDADGDRFYDVGEGMRGVSVTVLQGATVVSSTTTWDAGGYQLALAPGTYTVRFSGGDLTGRIEMPVVMGAQNVKVDGFAADATAGPTQDADVLTGTPGADFIEALGGFDWITPGRGNDTVDGGADRDMVSYSDMSTDIPGRGGAFMVDLDLAGGMVEIFGGEVDQLISIERATGSIFADVLRGTDGNDELRGIGDYDWFVATPGQDTLNGGNGLDMVTFLEAAPSGAPVVQDIFATDGVPPTGAAVGGVLLDLADGSNNTGLAEGLTLISVERVTGSSHQDVFFGDGEQNDFRGLGGFDWFVSSTGGRERYFGGDGDDTVTYFNAGSGVIASLRNGAGEFGGQETGYGSAGDAIRDLYFEIENLVGSDFDDRLEGNRERNDLVGRDGDDYLLGYGDIDYLKGGLGNDTLDGGAGSDFAIFDGNRGDYTLTRTSSTEVTVVGGDGTDSLINVEYFQFDDQTANIWELTVI